MLEHSIKRRLLFHEADPAGIAQFHQMFAWMQEVEQSLFRFLGVPLHDYWAAGGKRQIGWARQHASLDYLRPVLVDEQITVRLKLRLMGKRSLTFDVVIENRDEVKARGILKTVCMQGRETNIRAIPIPKLVRDKITPHMT